MPRPKFCTGTTRKGKRCKARPLKGTKRCAAHPLSTGLDPVFGSPEQAAAAGKLGGRPRLPRPHERMRELVEENVEELVAPYMDAVKHSVVVAKYEGEVCPSDHPDYGARIAAAERLLDRVYGKPRQLTELAVDPTSETGQLVSIVAGDAAAISAAAHDFLNRLLTDA